MKTNILGAVFVWVGMSVTGAESPAPYGLDISNVSPRAKILLSRLTLADANYRRSAMLDLGNIPEASVLPWVIKSFTQDPSPEVREAAVQVLVQRKEAGLEGLQLALKDANERVRAAAVDGLAVFRTPIILSLMTNACQDPDPRVKTKALYALNRVGASLPFQWEKFIAAAKDPHPDVRRQALGWFKGFLDKPEAMALLEAALKDPDLFVSCIAATYLIERRPEVAIFTLKLATKSPDPKVRGYALAELAKTKGAGWADFWAPWLNDSSEMIRAQAIKKLAENVLQGDAILLQYFQKASTDEQVRMITVLWDSWTPAALGVFLAGADNPFAVVRRPAVDALGKFPYGTPGVKEKLLEKLKDSEKIVRQSAMMSATVHLFAQDREAVIKSLQEAPDDVLTALVQLALDIPGTGPTVIQLLSSPQPAIREMAWRGVIGKQPAWDPKTRQSVLGEQGVVLNWAMKEGEPQWRVEATNRMAQWHVKKTPQEWAAALETKDIRLRENVIKGLVVVDDLDVLPLQIKLLEESPILPNQMTLMRTWFGHGQKAHPALGVMLKVGESTSQMVLSQMIPVIGNVKDASAIPTLARWTNKFDGKMKSAIAHAIGKIGSVEGASILLTFATDPSATLRHHAVENLGRLSLLEDPLPPVLTLLAQDPAHQVRVELARTLGRWNHPRCLPLLLTLLSDTNDWVVSEAISAVARLSLAGKAAAPQLERIVNEGSKFHRIVALQVLASYQDDQYTALVHRLAESPDQDIKIAAMLILNPTLRVAYVPPVASTAAVTPPLPQSDPNTVEHWLVKITSPLDGDRRTAVVRLAEWKEPRVWEALTLAVNDSSLNVVAALPVALTGWGNVALPILQRLTQHPLLQVRQNAFQAAASVMVHHQYGKEYFPVALSLSNQEGWKIQTAVRSLYRRWGPDVLPQAIDAWPKQTHLGRIALVDAFGPMPHPLGERLMVWGVQDPIPGVKIAAVAVALTLEGKKADAVLGHALKDPAGDVWRPAAMELARRKSPVALTFLQVRLTLRDAYQRRAAVEGLVAYGSSKANLWAEAVKDKDRFVRETALAGAVTLGGAPGLAIVKAAIKDPALDVRIGAYGLLVKWPAAAVLPLVETALLDQGKGATPPVRLTNSPPTATTLAWRPYELIPVKARLIEYVAPVKGAAVSKLLLGVINMPGESHQTRGHAARIWASRGERSSAGASAIVKAFHEAKAAKGFQGNPVTDGVYDYLKACQILHTPASLEAIIDLSKHALPEMRRAAIQELLAYNDPKADQALAACLTDTDLQVQEAARKSQAEIAKRPPPAPKKK